MKKYFVHLRNEQQGPFTLEELGPLGVERNTPVWYEGLADWVAAVQIPEIRDALFPVNPPPLGHDMPPVITHKHSSDIILPGAEEVPDVRKRKARLVPLIAIALLLLGVAVGFLMYRKQQSSPVVQENTRTKDSMLRKESEGELREQLKAKEEQHPTEFLSGKYPFMIILSAKV